MLIDNFQERWFYNIKAIASSFNIVTYNIVTINSINYSKNSIYIELVLDLLTISN